MRWRAAVLTAALALHAETARAADDDFTAFPLVVPHEKHWTRAGIGIGGVLAVGFVDYLLNTGARGGLVRQGDQTWSLRYDWKELRAKLVGDAFELDGNRIGTNYVAHPIAGSAYFQAARTSHLSFGESLFLATVASSTWEMFGEIRERLSVNDLIVTPVAGATIGEAVLELSGFFDRGEDRTSNRVLAAVFGPVRKLSDWIDGAEPRRATEVGPLGFPLDPFHRFQLDAGAAVTRQDGTHYGDARFEAFSEIINLPAYRRAGRYARVFSDGNVSSMRFTAALSGANLVDAGCDIRVVPVGFYYRRAAIAKSGALEGEGLFAGLRLGFGWRTHDYDRDRARPRDTIGVVSPVGVEAEYRFDRGRTSVRTGMHVSAALAGVGAYALADRERAHGSRDGLPTVARSHGYYHALGIGAATFVELGEGPFVLDARLRADAFRAIEGLDEDNESVDRRISLLDGRAGARATLSWQPRSSIVRLSLGVERNVRAGRAGDVSASSSESALFSTLGASF